MRITTNMLYQRGINSILDQQNRMLNTHQQLSTGRKVIVPSDNPVDATNIIRFNEYKTQSERYITNASSAKNTLEIEESTLGSMQNSLQRLKELGVQARSGAMSKENLNSITQEMRSIYYDLVSFANTRDQNNDPLFSGIATGTNLFSIGSSLDGNVSGDTTATLAGPIVTKDDTGAVSFTSASENATGYSVLFHGSMANKSSVIAQNKVIDMADSGSNVFQATQSVEIQKQDGTTEYAYKSTFFDNVADFIELTNLISPAEQQQANYVAPADRDPTVSVNSMAEDQLSWGELFDRYANKLDGLISHVSTVRASVGTRLKEIDDIVNFHNESVMYYEKAISNVRDVDFASSISQFMQQLMILNASQQSFAKARSLSLFQYL